MGILSDLIRAPIGQSPSRGRGMGAIGARPDLPMPPKRRRKGGLAGLIQRVKDKRLERPISIGGVGGGNIRPTQSFLKQAVEKIQNQSQPVPILPNQKTYASREEAQADMLGLSLEEYLAQRPQQVFEDVAKRDDFMSIGGLGGGRPMPINVPGGGGIDYGGAGGGLLDDFVPPPGYKEPLDSNDPPPDSAAGERVIRQDLLPPKRISDEIRIDDRPIIDPRRGMPPPPLPPQDFGFGPGIRPTEIRGLDGQFIGSAGVTPPDFVEKNIENKGPESLRDQYGLQPIVPPQNTNMIAELPPERIAEIGDPIPGTDPVTPTVDPVVTPTTQTDPTQTQMPMGAIDPVLLQQQTSEKLTDPLLRSLYFGTQDQPGFYQQLQQAGANLIGQDVPLQQTAGLTPLEVLARQQAISGIGGFEPFLQQNQNLVNQAIDQSVRAEELRDPYYGRAERQMQMGLGEELGGIGQARGITTGATNRFGGSLGRLGRQAIGSTQDYGGSLGESEDLLRGTLGAYDPGMTQQFYNPYEDAVVQQTIDDVLEAGDKQDIAARAREISSGAFGGSRARLGAEERRQDLGEGLAKALSGIRQTGYSQAQQTGLSEFARQREAERAASSGLAGLSGSRLGAQQQLGSTLRGLTGDQFGAQQQLAANLMGYGAAGSGARQNLATGLLGIGQQRGAGASALGSQLAGYGSQIGGIGQTQEQMRAGQRGELAGYGGIGRGIQETGLGRIYQQQLGQQQRPLGVLGQIGSMLPGYQASQTQIDSGYGMPTDPSAAGLGAAFSAYGALAPRQGQS